jgi:type III pantothenate kinase
MLLCLDVGNSQIHGGVFAGDALRCQFRKSTHPLGSADELGIFFTSVLRESGLDPKEIRRVAICCVVPAALYNLRAAAEKYFGCQSFVLQAGVKTGLKIRYRNPAEVGADRIAGAMAAALLQPNRDLIVVDSGTATTFDVIAATGDYLGGVILPGVGASADALASHTAKLPRVDLSKPEAALGRTTIESIQSGLYHGHVGAIRYIVEQLKREVFPTTTPYLFGTGGMFHWFQEERLVDQIVPELVLLGLKHAEAINR